MYQVSDPENINITTKLRKIESVPMTDSSIGQTYSQYASFHERSYNGSMFRKRREEKWTRDQMKSGEGFMILKMKIESMVDSYLLSMKNDILDAMRLSARRTAAIDYLEKLENKDVEYDALMKLDLMRFAIANKSPKDFANVILTTIEKHYDRGYDTLLMNTKSDVWDILSAEQANKSTNVTLAHAADGYTLDAYSSDDRPYANLTPDTQILKLLKVPSDTFRPKPLGSRVVLSEFLDIGADVGPNRHIDWNSYNPHLNTRTSFDMRNQRPHDLVQLWKSNLMMRKDGSYTPAWSDGLGGARGRDTHLKITDAGEAKRFDTGGSENSSSFKESVADSDALRQYRSEIPFVVAPDDANDRLEKPNYIAQCSLKHVGSGCFKNMAMSILATNKKFSGSDKSGVDLHMSLNSDLTNGIEMARNMCQKPYNNVAYIDWMISLITSFNADGKAPAELASAKILPLPLQSAADNVIAKKGLEGIDPSIKAAPYGFGTYEGFKLLSKYDVDHDVNFYKTPAAICSKFLKAINHIYNTLKEYCPSSTLLSRTFLEANSYNQLMNDSDEEAAKLNLFCWITGIYTAPMKLDIVSYTLPGATAPKAVNKSVTVWMTMAFPSTNNETFTGVGVFNGYTVVTKSSVMSGFKQLLNGTMAAPISAAVLDEKNKGDFAHRLTWINSNLRSSDPLVATITAACVMLPHSYDAYLELASRGCILPFGFKVIAPSIQFITINPLLFNRRSKTILIRVFENYLKIIQNSNIEEYTAILEAVYGPFIAQDVMAFWSSGIDTYLGGRNWGYIEPDTDKKAYAFQEKTRATYLVLPVPHSELEIQSERLCLNNEKFEQMYLGANSLDPDEFENVPYDKTCVQRFFRAWVNRVDASFYSVYEHFSPLLGDRFNPIARVPEYSYLQTGLGYSTSNKSFSKAIHGAGHLGDWRMNIPGAESTYTGISQEFPQNVPQTPELIV